MNPKIVKTIYLYILIVFFAMLFTFGFILRSKELYGIYLWALIIGVVIFGILIYGYIKYIEKHPI